MSLDRKLDQVLARHAEVESLLGTGTLPSDQFTKLSREYAEMEELSVLIKTLRKSQAELKDLEQMMSDQSADKDMRALAEEDFYSLRDSIPQIEKNIQIALLPKDAADAKNAILEIRAGTGGDEAALFAGDLCNIYRRYAADHGWRFDIIELAENDLGGIRQMVAEISGREVFARMKYESGVHRVQRVPATETQGRIHTSAATVAVLPEAEDVDIVLRDDEMRIDVMRSGGAGGQHVNKTETKVEVLFDVNGSAGLNDEEKVLVFQKLGARINDAGVLGITSQKERSQLGNKEIVQDRLKDLLDKALEPRIKRVKTKPTKQSVEDRLQEKKAQAEKKALRQKPGLK